MQLVNHPPVANSQPIAVASLKLGDVVVLGVRVRRNFLDLFHNPLLPVHRKPGKGLGKGFCGDDLVHLLSVTLSNNDVKQKVDSHCYKLRTENSSACPSSPISKPSARESGRRWSATRRSFAWARTSASTAALSKSPKASLAASDPSA